MKYISIEKEIERSKETYYEMLQVSSAGWHEGENNYEPFVRYMLGIIVSTYREFSSRVKLITTSGLSKPDRIREIIINDLLNAGEILKISGGRYTKYVWNGEE